MAEEAGRKPYLILVHGLRGDHHGLLQIAGELGGDFEVLVPDLPGSGDNPELGDKSLDGYAEWLHGYCAELSEKPYIVGHSMGSIIVSYFAEKYPGDTREKVVLLAPIFRDKAGERSSKMLYGALKTVLFPFPPKLKYKVVASKKVSYVISHFLTYDKRKQKEIDELHYKYSGRFASAESLLADAEISMTKTARVSKNKDVLLCIGAYDRLTRAELVEDVAKKKGAEYRKVDGSGHLLNYEQPGEVARVVKEFLLGV
ncbi:MAG: alpha/beta hydrolase [Candidatus Nomurabacteria bacterium]|jgi:pimeloyl-ACP methyl ester carboxylesterase|nr:alpha/beta hydrolase [Candidatus Nomurabacteria bacterium]